MSMIDTNLRQEAGNAPDKPGVYLFKNSGGKVLYVGKAKSLKKRVRSYFQKNQPIEKVRRLVEQSRFLDFFVTGTEVEALVLECNLIKRYRPKYNVEYRDDKSYPYLAINLKEDWPRVRYTRERHRADTRYFGPYTNARALKETLDTLLKIFPLRTCADSVLVRSERMKRPCLYYHIGRCPGPCIHRVAKEEYRRTIEQISAFLEGRQEQVIADLAKEMQRASSALEYERAAVFRDRIAMATQTLEKQRVSTDSRLNQDVFGLAAEADLACVQMLKVRSGKLVGSEDFLIDLPAAGPEQEILTAFIKQYYDGTPVFPDEIVLPGELEEPEAIAAWLGAKKGRSFKLAVPKRGFKRRLVEMAVENAWHSMGRFKVRSDHESKKVMAGLTELQSALGLDGPPATIECYDISNIAGTNAVGSMVVFLGGRPARQAYRRFKIKTGQGSPNDFAMMKEIIGRRLARGTKDPKFAARPDLIIVDGGKPQLRAAVEAMAEAGITGVAVAGLAKKREELFIPGRPEPIQLPDRSAGLYLLQRLRDEAHRFAVDYHRRLRSKSMKSSNLDGVPGIGQKRRTMLLRKFGSLKKIRSAGEEELVAAGLPRPVAKTLRESLGES
jgi:excinuclease ABC subunit C